MLHRHERQTFPRGYRKKVIGIVFMVIGLLILIAGIIFIASILSDPIGGEIMSFIGGIVFIGIMIGLVVLIIGAMFFFAGRGEAEEQSDSESHDSHSE